MRRSGNPRTTAAIADGLPTNRLNPDNLRASDLEAVDEFRFRGRAATVELPAKMATA